MEVLRRLPRAGPLIEWCQEMPVRYKTYAREHFDDLPEACNWIWDDT